MPVDLPAGHDWQVVANDAPTVVEYFATGQESQLSAFIPTVVEYLPAAQLEQDAAPADDEYVPAAQIVHTVPGVDVASPEYPEAQRLHAFADAVFV